MLPTNVGLAANPPIQIDPNIELAGMSPAEFGIPGVAVPPRKVYQRGATSLQWTAEDRNGDRLVYDVMYREVGEAEALSEALKIPAVAKALDGKKPSRVIFVKGKILNLVV